MAVSKAIVPLLKGKAATKIVDDLRSRIRELETEML